jgi:flagellar biosynthesis protein
MNERNAGGANEPLRCNNAAVALAYREGEAAPRVLAKGNGLLAEAIIARAKSSGVFVHESPALVALLMQVDIDREIPPSLYVAVAQLLAWIYKLEHQANNET